MDEVWIVFVAGSVLSFALMMILYFGFFVRRRTKLRAPLMESRPSSANRHFLDFLRAEAIARVNDNLASVMAQQSKAAAAHTRRGLEQGVAARLAESRQTLQFLFSSEVVAAYDKAVAALDGRHVSASDAVRRVTEFKGKVSGYLEDRAGLAGRQAASG